MEMCRLAACRSIENSLGLTVGEERVAIGTPSFVREQCPT